MDYYQRLVDDSDLLKAPLPDGYTVEMWQHSVEGVIGLDVSLVNQLMSQSYQPMASIRGLGETLIQSSKDGTMQPVAAYVPTTYVPGRKAPLIVFLHGHPQSETSLIAPQFIDDMAEKTGTIIVAPYGRGYYDFQGSESDVYDALAAAEHAFAVDPRKRYLVGYSMGGFSVFLVGPMHPNDWSAVMSIAGALLGSRSHLVTAMMPSTPFYILTGSRDESIPTQYPTTTAVFLRNAGIPVTFYSDPNATHRLFTLRTIFEQAWNDMEAGIVRTPWSLTATSPLISVPPTTFKT
ncbi:MAG: dienelactone hydrolase family protein [Candidatus Eremiobacteraeota bacterium]|nr:dienelactone hydrolase family protein [Candidatus Eremiobacteraeota bacterium]